MAYTNPPAGGGPNRPGQSYPQGYEQPNQAYQHPNYAYPGQAPPPAYGGSGISAADFRHEYELAASITTMAIAVVFLVLVGWLTNLLIALAIPVLFMLLSVIFMSLTNKGHMVQLSPNQFPELYRTCQEIAWRLNMPMPDVFIQQSPVLNAFAMGLTKNGIVVVHSALIEQMSPEEAAVIIAHEFGHIKCRHSIYTFLQSLTAGNIMGGGLIFMPLQWLFFFASRMMEYSADRAGLIGSTNVHASVTAMIKLSVGGQLYEEMSIQAYMQQIDEFNAATGSKLVEFLGDLTHPLTVNRIQNMLRFYRSPKYQQLASRFGRAGTSTLTAGAVGTRDLFYRVAAKAEYDRDIQQLHQRRDGGAPSSNPTLTCSTCGAPLEAHGRFCVRCGTPVAGAVALQPAPPPTVAAQAGDEPPASAAPAPPVAATPQGQAGRQVEAAQQAEEAPAVRVVRRIRREEP